jgi:hypothetical protein
MITNPYDARDAAQYRRTTKVKQEPHRADHNQIGHVRKHDLLVRDECRCEQQSSTSACAKQIAPPTTASTDSDSCRKASTSPLVKPNDLDWNG